MAGSLAEKIDELRRAIGEGKKKSKKEAAFGPGAESPGPSKTPQPSEPMGGTRHKVTSTGKKIERKR
jgi:hypothetical protein